MTIQMSVQKQVAQMDVGDIRYIEAHARTYQGIMRQWNAPKSRRLAATKDFIIECSLYQALPVGRIGDVKLLVRVERKA